MFHPKNTVVGLEMSETPGNSVVIDKWHFTIFWRACQDIKKKDDPWWNVLMNG